jgi:hypothetical protein
LNAILRFPIFNTSRRDSLDLFKLLIRSI